MHSQLVGCTIAGTLLPKIKKKEIVCTIKGKELNRVTWSVVFSISWLE